MTHVTIEYVIMIPILILQILVLPMAAKQFMSIWEDNRRTLELQNAAILLGSTVQQLYFSLDHAAMPSGSATFLPKLPPLIENYPYTGTATLRLTSGSGPNSSKVLQINLLLATTTASASVVLGYNAFWLGSTFSSNSTNACVGAQKFSNGTIFLWFGG
jgi:hypothetical protein